MILVGGENLMDMIQTGKQNENSLFEAVPGGSPYNLAMAAGRQGAAVGYLTPISQDSNGDQLAQKLIDSHVQICGPRLCAPTSLAMVTIEEGIPSYAFYREGTAERLVELDQLAAQLSNQVSVFHIGSLGLIGGDDAETWEAFAQMAKDKGVALSLDPNVRSSLIFDAPRYRARIMRLIAQADILKLSDEDLDWLYQDCSPPQAQAQLTEQTQAKVLVLTKGAQGSALWHEGQWHDAPAHPIKAFKDTVGAGDTFMASMLVWLTQKGHSANLAALSLADKQEMQGYCARAAALNCEQQGCNPPWSRALNA